MNRPAKPVVAMLFAVVALTGVVVALIGGSSWGMLVVGLSAAAVAAALAVLSWPHPRPRAMTDPVIAHWWKFLTGGVGVLAAVIVLTTATGEVAASMWWPMTIALVCALMLLIAGFVLGVAHRARLVRNPPR